MRRRSFRPSLESLDFRITPSDVTGTTLAVAGTAQATTVNESSDDNENPLWNQPSDPGDGTDPDEVSIWCPMIG